MLVSSAIFHNTALKPYGRCKFRTRSLVLCWQLSKLIRKCPFRGERSCLAGPSCFWSTGTRWCWKMASCTKGSRTMFEATGFNSWCLRACSRSWSRNTMTNLVIKALIVWTHWSGRSTSGLDSTMTSRSSWRAANAAQLQKCHISKPRPPWERCWLQDHWKCLL